MKWVHSVHCLCPGRTCRAVNLVLAPFLAAMAAADLLSAVCKLAELANRDVAQNIWG